MEEGQENRGTEREAQTAKPAQTEGTSLEALLKAAKKQVFYARLAAVFTGALFLAITIALVIVIPQVSETLGYVNGLLADANNTLTDIDTMSASITQTSDDLNRLVGENADTLTQSVQKLSEIDFEGINVAVQDLQDAIGPLAEAMNRLSSFSLFGR